MTKKISILFIDDDQIECIKIDRVIKKLDLPHKITKAKNGEKAFKILNTKKNIPDLILLDLNMSKMNGIEFLTKLKKDDVLCCIPTVIVTTSQNKQDLLDCYKAGVSGYIIKPLRYSEYVSKMQTVLSYWSENELMKLN
ncbi:response regulator [uncultured Polaribacter sp.]|uniref:response regulator n=1 Tax=uncultured Polaribacter sp. TaxID=174711 RepID=UPI0026086FB6|nr:response regulator [uncultured Polaribacter sp.]